MTQVRNFGPFNHLFDEVFGSSNPGWQRGAFPLVNISEDDHSYYIEVVAPGLEKSDFSVNVEKGLLTVLYERKASSETEGKKFYKKEFTPNNFKRTFSVENTIDLSKIEAKYENGILVLTLPKMEDVKPASTPIEIK